MRGFASQENTVMREGSREGDDSRRYGLDTKKARRASLEKSHNGQAETKCSVTSVASRVKARYPQQWQDFKACSDTMPFCSHGRLAAKGQSENGEI